MNESEIKLVDIEVAYAQVDKQLILNIEVVSDCTIEQAIEQSGMLQQFQEIDLDKNKIGVFGKLAKKTAALKSGDRIEIYRPLIADPKEVRRQREAEGKKMKKGS